MQIVSRLLTLALGLFLISAGITKFTTGHVFQYIEYQSGIDLFYPFLNNLTGVAEILAGSLILFRQTRLVGSLIASGLLLAAIGFHLSPWLGLSIPTGLADDAADPWGATDFTSSTSSATFILAIVTALGARSVVRSELRRRTTGSMEATSTEVADAVVAGVSS